MQHKLRPKTNLPEQTLKKKLNLKIQFRLTEYRNLSTGSQFLVKMLWQYNMQRGTGDRPWHWTKRHKVQNSYFNFYIIPIKLNGVSYYIVSYLMHGMMQSVCPFIRPFVKIHHDDAARPRSAILGVLCMLTKVVCQFNFHPNCPYAWPLISRSNLKLTVLP